MSQTNNNYGGNAPLHLNVNMARAATYAVASPTSNQSAAESARAFQSQQLGDIYEFQSSPEDDVAPMGAGGGYFPLANASIGSHQKSSSASSIPNIVATVSGSTAAPPKRIKTAVLAKKLLAAAVDSNIIDPSSLPISQQSGQRSAQRIDEETLQQDEAKSDCELGEEGGMDAVGDELEEEGDDKEAAGDDEAEEGMIRQPPRAHSFSCIAEAAVHEQKRVPPLRISLLKTPSEEGEGPSSSSISPSSGLRKSRGGKVAIGPGRKMGGGSKKEDLQRVTRSRVRQIATTNDGEDADEPCQPSRKRRNKGGALETASNFPLEEENMMMGSVMEGGTAREEGTMAMPIIGGEEEQPSEDSQQSATMSISTGVGGVQDEKEKPTIAKPQQPSPAALLLAKSSLEQSVSFEALMREKWTRQYKVHLAYILEKVANTKLVEQQPRLNETTEQSLEMKLDSREWPESLQKLHIEQERRRDELAEEHRLDQERIYGMAQRELARLEEATNLQKSRGTMGELAEHQQGGRGGRIFSIVSYLRDAECYDPTVLATSLNNLNGTNSSRFHVHTKSLQQIQQRFTYLANTTKNRHTMEAHALLENQKAEWQRVARRAQRENEQQQLMMKGPIGSVAKQQHLPQISFPPDFWVDSAIHPIPVPEIQLPQFQINPHVKIE